MKMICGTSCRTDEGGEFSMGMKKKIQQDEILRQAFSKNPNALNDVEKKVMQKFLRDQLDEVNRFLASRLEHGKE